MTFYNTINETGETLKKSEKQTETQEARILRIFRDRFEVKVFHLTPFQVQKIYESKYGATPITSIRRAITNLTNAGKLLKSQKQGEGNYGKKNYLWMLNRPSRQMEIFNGDQF